MGILEAIIGFFTALPALVKLGQEVFTFFKKLVKDDPVKFIKDAGEAFEFLNKAESPEDRKAAAAKIQALIKRL